MPGRRSQCHHLVVIICRADMIAIQVWSLPPGTVLPNRASCDDGDVLQLHHPIG